MNNHNSWRSGNKQRHDCQENGFRRGPSSYHMHDSDIVFEKLALSQGDTFLDLGCGGGDYSIHAAKLVGEAGNIYAVDFWPEMLNKIYEDAKAQGINNIHPVVSDIRKKIDVADTSIDVCLLSTVLHIMDFSTETEELFTEIKRVMKLEGKLAVIECKKENSLFGPPMHVRISPEELEKGLKKYEFFKCDYADLGSNYMMLFALRQIKLG